MKIASYLILFFLFATLGTFLFYWKEMLDKDSSPKNVALEEQAVSKPHSVTEDQVSCHPIFPVKGKSLVVPPQEGDSDLFSKKFSFLFEAGWPRAIFTTVSSITLLSLIIRAIRIKKARLKKISPPVGAIHEY